MLAGIDHTAHADMIAVFESGDGATHGSHATDDFVARHHGVFGITQSLRTL